MKSKASHMHFSTVGLADRPRSHVLATNAAVHGAVGERAGMTDTQFMIKDIRARSTTVHMLTAFGNLRKRDVQRRHFRSLEPHVKMQVVVFYQVYDAVLALAASAEAGLPT
jgi:hypothetical protein